MQIILIISKHNEGKNYEFNYDKNKHRYDTIY